MKTLFRGAGLALVLGFLIAGTGMAGEEHHATRLGNPATVFAPTIYTVDDLRSRFSDPRLRPDMASILRQWGWKGDTNDLFAAAASAEVVEWKIGKGEKMPFMSSREEGDPICLRNVYWEGAEPISAYAFTFTSRGEQYRCITPKTCSNFYLEDLGIHPIHALALACAAPGEKKIGQSAEVCLTLTNGGNVAESNVIITLPIPAGVRYATNSGEGVFANDFIVWKVASLAPSNSLRLCATLDLRKPGLLNFAPAASSDTAKAAAAGCATEVTGIPALLLETADVVDPVEVGKTVTYIIKVTNQGNAPGTHIKMVCTLPESEEFASSTGITPASADGKTITMETVDTLDPKTVAEWQVTVKALKADDARFNVSLSSDEFEKPITKEESTHLY